MSFNSAAYLAYQERLLEPGSVLVKGNHRRYTSTAMADKNKWLNSLTDDQRRVLKEESLQQYRHERYD